MLRQRYIKSRSGKKRTYQKKSRNYAPSRQTLRAVRSRSGEKKLLDTSISVNPMLNTTGTNGGITCVNLIRSGNSYYNRIGRKVFLKSLRIYGSFFSVYTQPADGNNNGSTIRMAVVFDKQPNGGALPTYDTIFGHTIQDGTESTNILDPIKPDNFGRFSILRDCKFDMNAPDTPLAAGDITIINSAFDEYIDLKNKMCQYGGDSSPMTIADITNGAIYVIFRCTDTTTGENIYGTTEAFARLRYSD